MKYKTFTIALILFIAVVATSYDYRIQLKNKEIETLKAEKLKLYREYERLQNIRYCERMKYEERLKSFNKN